jgi:trans-aconitate methyltransferase
MSDPESASAQRWDPALYDQRAAFVSLAAADLVDLLAPVPGESILDLGCGTGALAAAIAARGARVVGVDASPEMIARARAAAPAVDFRVGDGQQLSSVLADGEQFDAVFSNAALHWMTRADDTALGLARALKPGGRLIAELGGAGCVATVTSAAGAALRARGEDPARWLRWYFPTIPDYAAVLARAGLQPRLLWLFDRPTRLAGVAGLADWLQVFLAPLAAHLGADWRSFVGEMEARCRPHLFDGTDWVLDYVRLRLRATRAILPGLQSVAPGTTG